MRTASARRSWAGRAPPANRCSGSVTDIRVEQDEAVLVLTVDRPHARNALAPSTMAELDALLMGLASRDDVRCAVLTGAGERAFIAGGDLKELESERGVRGGAAASALREPGAPARCPAYGVVVPGYIESQCVAVTRQQISDRV